MNTSLGKRKRTYKKKVPFIKRRGNLQAGTSNSVTIPYARRLANSADQVTYLHRSILKTPIAYTLNPTFYSTDFKLTDLPVSDISSISTTWDHYRIEEVTVTLYRLDNQSAPSQGRYDNSTGEYGPTVVPADQHILSVVSYDQLIPTAGGTWDNMMQWASARHTLMGSGRSDKHVRRFRPLVAVEARQSLTGVAVPAVLGIKDGWLDLGFPDVSHYGYNVLIRDDIHPTAQTALAVYQIKIEYLIAVKGSR